ncbi:MAG TPA: hypothetical protein VIW28_09465 [Gemmatimonadales bacterium]|jgi:hypothetical protein
MIRRCRSLRACFPALAALQLTMPAAAALADARLDEFVAGPAHIESHSTAACARIHPADCVFHRFLSAPGAPARRAPQGLCRPAEPVPVPVVRRVRDAGVHERLPHSRAPPPLS